MTSRKSLYRYARMVSLAGLLVLFAGCSITDNLLSVNDPDEINEDLLDDASLVKVLVAGVIRDFVHMYDDPFIWQGSMFTDEQITGINWESTARLSQRIVKFTESPPDAMFSAISRARFQGDSVSGRLRTLLQNPNSDDQLALTLTLAGYSMIVMGEAMCEGVIGTDAARVLQPVEMFMAAVPRLEEGLTIALAAGDDDIANLARTGLARAQLSAGNMADVKTWAAQVTAGFEWWLEYSNNSTGEQNHLQWRVTGANHSLGMHPNFLQGPFDATIDVQPDPRVQHTVDFSLGHNRLTHLYKPYQGLRFSSYNGATQGFGAGGTPLLYDRPTNILLANDLEAQHHFAEADGPTAATAAFVNARQTFGNQTVVTYSLPADANALMADLRDERGRDLYLGGFRLGDLRRWLRQGVGDFFPSGQHPTTEWGNYGTATCFPIPVEEYEGNPNLTKPGA